MRSGCKFSDSFCLGFHRLPYGALCENLKYSKVSISGIKDSFEIRQTVGFNEACYNMLYQSEACGLCALYQLSNMNVHAVKIVGRAEKSNKILSDIKLVNNNLQIIDHCDNEKMYLEKMVFPENRARVCALGYSCYYPEIRFGNPNANHGGL